MSGSRAGGIQARDKILKDNPNFYREIGILGGKGDRGQRADKGFASMDKAKHLAASAKGGTISRRVKK